HLGTLQTLGQIVEFLAGDEPQMPREIGVERPAPLRLELGAGTAPAAEVQRWVLSNVTLDEGRPHESVGLRPGSLVWVGDDGDGDGLARALADRLRALGFQARLVRRDEIGSLAAPERLDGLVLPAPASGGDDATVRDAFRLLRLSAPGLRRAGREG